jgi:putative transposase
VLVPRPHRLQVPGAAYHISARAVAGRELYRTDDDRISFVKLLTRVMAERDWVCGAYCLMTTHYHLLIRTPEPDLASGIQEINSCYAQEFNRRYGLEGHVFFRRYHSAMIERDGHLLEVGRYMPTNPVRAGLCRLAEDWPWSSYPALLGLCPPPPFLSPDWLLELFGRDRRRARARYRAFVEDVS